MKPKEDAMDIEMELQATEQEIIHRACGLPAQKLEALPRSLRTAIKRLKRVRERAESHPDWPVF